MPPSTIHEDLVELIRQEPEVFFKLVLGDLPSLSETRIRAADPVFNQVMEFRSDAVLIAEHSDSPVVSLISEVQLREDADKLYSLAVYTSAQHALTRKPVVLVIVAPNRRVATWARRLGRECGIGPPNRVVVIGPEEIPWIGDNDSSSQPSSLLLAVLSAIAHGNETGGLVEVRGALKRLWELDDSRILRYIEIILRALTPRNRRQVENEMREAREFQPTLKFVRELKKRFETERSEGKAEGVATGKTEGEALGKAGTLLKLLAARQLSFNEAQREMILKTNDCEQLDQWILLAVSATTIREVLGEFDEI